MFIVLEGIDGSGKSMQVQLLFNALFHPEKNTSVLMTKEPTDSQYGKLIRKTLSSKKALKDLLLNWKMAQLFALDRAEHIYGRNHLEQTFAAYLADGFDVICDRYILSSLAYNGQGDMADLVLTLNKDFPVPDLTIYIDIPVDVALKRIAQRGKPLDLYEKQLHHYLNGYKEAISAGHECLGRIVVVDGDRPVEDVHQEILSIVKSLEK